MREISNNTSIATGTSFPRSGSPDIRALVAFFSLKGFKTMPSILRALNAALNDMQLDSKDEAIANLARTYANKIDNNPTDAKILKDLGPELMKALAELQMTPKARAAISTAKEAVSNDSDDAAETLAELRGTW